MDFIIDALAFGPFRQLLSETAIVRHVARGIIGKTFFLHAGFHLVSAGGVRGSASTFFRRVGMQRKVSEFNFQPVVLFEFLNTPGTEVAPGSNVVGEDFENQGLSHISSVTVFESPNRKS